MQLNRFLAFSVVICFFMVNGSAQSDANKEFGLDPDPTSLRKKGAAGIGIPINRALPVSLANVGIGTLTPRTTLEVMGELRAGSAGLQWSHDSIGQYSVAFGLNTLARGTHSAAWGEATRATGENATAWGEATTADSEGATAWGFQTRASGIYSSAMGRSTAAPGPYSTAMGDRTTASGFASTSMGGFTKASSNYSTAMGAITKASEYASTAMGDNTTASGFASTSTGLLSKAAAIASLTAGLSTQSNGYASTAIGMYNDTLVGVQTEVSDNTPLFIVGNGDDESNRSNAMVVQKDGSALWGGEFVSTSPNDPPASGAGTRMMWYPDKAAFRAGRVSGTDWDIANIGNHSFAMGLNAMASGESSTALGEMSRATGDYSFAFGDESSASGSYSTAIGQFAKAESMNCVAVGSLNVGGGDPVNWNLTDPIFEIGNGTILGRRNAMTVLKNGDVGIGVTSPNETVEVAGNGRMFIGDGGGANRTGLLIDAIDGNPDQEYVRIVPFDYGANANMDLYFPSDVGIGTSVPNYKLHVAGTAGKPGGGSWSNSSDIRLKQNVRGYDAGLVEIMRIRPVSYQYNELSGYDTEIEYVGVIAQELQEIAPDMVSTFTKGDQEYLAVDNSEMTYMLINAVKELAEQVAQQAEQVARQNEIIEALRAENVRN